MTFLIRADASFEIGTGHVMRCISLGQMLADAGHKVLFLTQTENSYLNDRILKEGFGLKNFKKQDIIKDAEITSITGKEINADWIVTDGYNFKTDFQRTIKDSGFKLMCIDDIADCHYVSDIILNQNLNAEILYNYSCEKYTRLYLGINNVLLRREIIKSLKNNTNTTLNHLPNNILILKGGSELFFPVESMLDIFNKNIIRPINVKVISNSNSFESKINNPNLNYIHKHFTNSIQSDLCWCDIAITAAGSTVWELLYLKKKFMVIGIAENQRIIVEELSKNNYAISLGWADKFMTERLENIIVSDFYDLGNLNELIIKTFEITAFG